MTRKPLLTSALRLEIAKQRTLDFECNAATPASMKFSTNPSFFLSPILAYLLSPGPETSVNNYPLIIVTNL